MNLRQLIVVALLALLAGLLCTLLLLLAMAGPR
jgi:hypothetical protein